MPAPRDQRPAGRGHVVADDADLVVDAPGDLGHGHLLGAEPRLVHDREVGVEHLGEADGDLRAPGVRRDGDDPVAVEPKVVEVPGKELLRGHVVDRDREEPLDLPGMEVRRQKPVDAGELSMSATSRPEIGSRGLALRSCREYGNHGITAVMRFADASLAAWIAKQELHQMLVDRRAARLDEEHVGAADRLAVTAVRLVVRERVELDLAEVDAEPLGDPLRELEANGEKTISRFCGVSGRA